jgi:hypothetical protein
MNNSKLLKWLFHKFCDFKSMYDFGQLMDRTVEAPNTLLKKLSL